MSREIDVLLVIHVIHEMLRRAAFGVRMALLVSVAGMLGSCSGRWEMKPLAKPEPPFLSEDEGGGRRSQVTGKAQAIYRFFEEDYAPGGFQYAYPDASRITVVEDAGHASEVALLFDLDPDEWAGGSVAVSKTLFKLNSHFTTGGLQFWARGEKGGEQAVICLIDDQSRDGKQGVVRVPLTDHGSISTEWKQFSIPLAKFGRKGAYWDAAKKSEMPAPFDWDAVTEFRIESRKGENSSFRVFVDDIFLVRDAFPEAEDVELWEDKEEAVPAPPLAQTPAGNGNYWIFKDGLPVGGASYTYGGQTQLKISPTTAKDNPALLGLYLDNTDYSGITLNLGAGNKMDLASIRDKNGALQFWAKAAPGTEKVYLGLIDDASDGRKIAVKRYIGDFGKLDTSWRHFRIPLKEFGDRGFYWDDKYKYEGGGKVDWRTIDEIRFSTQKAENKPDSGKPIILWLDEVRIIDEMPGYLSTKDYWESYKPAKPDLVLHDFNKPQDQTWSTDKGDNSKISYQIEAVPDQDKGKVLEAAYELKNWIDLRKDYGGETGLPGDWSGYWGLRFDLFSGRAVQPMTVLLADAEGERFVSHISGYRGWSQILLPFKDFKRSGWQAEGVTGDGKLDLSRITFAIFKPKGGGMGSFRLDNITLTGSRQVQEKAAPKALSLSVKGDPAKLVNPKINPNLFGVNIQVTDPFMFDSKTPRYLKEAGHPVIRFPGGLYADEYHWKQGLDRKDPMAMDTDEYLQLLKKIGAQGMITVNYGTGTPEEAAEWVRYVNLEKKAKVRFWEIGNEVNLPFHPQFTTAEKYGARALEFIKAMKAVDPSIQVAVIWGEEPWNKTVLEMTREAADAVVIHNYPQGPDDEEDGFHLSVAKSLDGWIPELRRQLKESGLPGKNYEIWMTEWNSTWSTNERLTQWINGLYVADFLGRLAHNGVEQADFWAVHNPIGPGFGDHGYLSRGVGEEEGDNVRRPPYFGFKLARHALRGSLAECSSGDEFIPCYLSIDQGRKSLMLINKYPKTQAGITLDIPGFQGEGKLHRLVEENSRKGASEESLRIQSGMKLTLPARSLTVVEIP